MSDMLTIGQGMMQGGAGVMDLPWLLPIVIIAIVVLLIVGLVLLLRKPHKAKTEDQGTATFGKTASIHWRTALQHDLDERLTANEEFHALPREALRR